MSYIDETNLWKLSWRISNSRIKGLISAQYSKIWQVIPVFVVHHCTRLANWGRRLPSERNIMTSNLDIPSLLAESASVVEDNPYALHFFFLSDRACVGRVVCSSQRYTYMRLIRGSEYDIVRRINAAFLAGAVICLGPIFRGDHEWPQAISAFC